MMKTRDSIVQKMFDLKLKEKKICAKGSIFSSSNLELLSQLPTVEETLQILAAALRKSAEPGLNKEEVQRLQVVSSSRESLQGSFRRLHRLPWLEKRLAELEAKQDVPVKKT